MWRILFTLAWFGCPGSAADRAAEPQRAVVSVPSLRLHVSKKSARKFKDGASAMARGNFGEAAGHYRLAIHDTPKFAAAYNNLGVCYSMLGRDREADDAFQSAIALDKSLAEPHANVALLRLKDDNYAAAEQEARIAIRMDPMGPKQNFLLGLSLAGQRKFTAEALAHFKKAGAVFPIAQKWAESVEKKLATMTDLPATPQVADDDHE
jgi:Flp pilus assembly protein TadD